MKIQKMLGKDYWNERYLSKETGWDLGEISTPLKSYFDQLENKFQKILIPGSGSGYEAEYLWKLGFNNTYIADVSYAAMEKFKRRVPDFPHKQIIVGDFFELDETFDLIIEQTFFCALNPVLRKDYIDKMYNLLNTGGKLVGLLFNKIFPFEGPPFGGKEGEYESLFKPYFKFRTFETAFNSVQPRSNTELFFIFEKKETL
ncbi:methyltransferase domain-containing protein [Aegicerativicinus sediminis]|uniref:methyltransferase domain-containing protein n=1 Tax=Aegicerativicinus sediminis TaxID=2893202 RepID=UPI001E3ABD96|nr:methyltransferase domain-containing protein [Aegicerativicinus sediminis]